MQHEKKRTGALRSRIDFTLLLVPSRVYRTGGLQPMPGYMPIGNRESGCTTEQAASE
jgi:hypothetical protein